MSEAAGADEGGVTAAGGGRGGVRGRCLSPEDLLATKDFVHGLATQVRVLCAGVCIMLLLCC